MSRCLSPAINIHSGLYSWSLAQYWVSLPFSRYWTTWCSPRSMGRCGTPTTSFKCTVSCYFSHFPMCWSMRDCKWLMQRSGTTWNEEGRRSKGKLDVNCAKMSASIQDATRTTNVSALIVTLMCRFWVRLFWGWGNGQTCDWQFNESPQRCNQ